MWMRTRDLVGANIKVEGNTAIIDGVERFTGAQVSSPDLRAGAALVLAGLAADGITIVEDIHYIERGYERLTRSCAVWEPRSRRCQTSGRSRNSACG